jgi:hypothetical protein
MRIICIVLALAGLVPGLLAQEAKTRQVSLRLLSFSGDPSLREVFVHDPASDPALPSVASKVQSYLNREGPSLNLFGNTVAFTLKQDRDSMKRPGEFLAKVELAPSLRSAILVFLPGQPGGETTHRIFVIDDSAKSFPAGSFHVTNLSPVPVKLTLEKQPYEFKPGATLIIDKPPMAENQHARMQAFAFISNEWRSIGTGLWPNPGVARGVQLLYQEPVSGQVQLRAYDDVPVRPPAPAPRP